MKRGLRSQAEKNRPGFFILGKIIKKEERDNDEENIFAYVAFSFGVDNSRNSSSFCPE